MSRVAALPEQQHSTIIVINNATVSCQGSHKNVKDLPSATSLLPDQDPSIKLMPAKASTVFFQSQQPDEFDHQPQNNFIVVNKAPLHKPRLTVKLLLQAQRRAASSSVLPNPQGSSVLVAGRSRPVLPSKSSTDVLLSEPVRLRQKNFKNTTLIFANKTPVVKRKRPRKTASTLLEAPASLLPLQGSLSSQAASSISTGPSKSYNMLSSVRKHLKSQQSAESFTDAVAKIIKQMYDESDDTKKLDSAVLTCVALRKYASKAKTTFRVELKNYCLKTITNHLIDDKNVLLNLENEFGSCTEPQKRNEITTLFQQKESHFKRKVRGCLRLVSRLFLSGEIVGKRLKTPNVLTIGFLISFIDAAVLTKDEDVYEGLLEMFSELGCDLEAKMSAPRNDMEKCWIGVTTAMTQICQDPSASDRLRAVAKMILLAKDNGWRATTEEEWFRLRLLELSPKLAATPLRFASTVKRIRSDLSSLPHEKCSKYFTIFMERLQSHPSPHVTEQRG